MFAKFRHGDKLVFRFAVLLFNGLQQPAAGTLAPSGNEHNIFGIDTNSFGNHSPCGWLIQDHKKEKLSMDIFKNVL